jgi:hypothetical protein
MAISVLEFLYASLRAVPTTCTDFSSALHLSCYLGFDESYH